MASAFDLEYRTIADWAGLLDAEADAAPTVGQREALLAAGHAAIDRRVKPYEAALHSNAEQQLAALRTEHGRKQEISLALDSIIDTIESGESVDAGEFMRVDNAALMFLRRTGDRADRARRLAEQLLDPLGALDDLETRMPSLRRKPFTT